MSGERDEAGARALLRELVSDVRQWAQWNQVLGAEALPMEPPLSPEAHRESAPDARPAQTPPVQERAAAAPGPGPAPKQTPTDTPHAPQQTRTRPTFEPSKQPSNAQARLGKGPLAPIRLELGDCTRCGLHESRKNLVFGVGSDTADLVIVGEAPGRNEDLTGEPFVGRSGQLLTRMLGAIGLRRDQVYICNVIKCRPPSNRDPSPQEVATCSPFLIRQVQAINPRVVMTVGKFASQCLLGVDESMGQMRGNTHQWEGLPVVPTYHPAYLLRSPAAKPQAWEDLLRVRSLLRS
jgi:uracil-DNA glycosylase family 4